MKMQEDVTKDFKLGSTSWKLQVNNKTENKKNFKMIMEPGDGSQEMIDTEQKQHEDSKHPHKMFKQSDASPYIVQDPKMQNPANQNQLEMDARLMFKACKQLIQAEEAFIKVLIRRSPAQKQQIKAKFYDLYNLVLVTELKRGLGSSWHPLIMVVFTDRDSVQSDICHTALQRADCLPLIEILTNKDNQSIWKLQQTYSKEHKNTLEMAIVNHLQGPVQTLILILCKGMREENTDVDVKQAEVDAQELLQWNEDGWTADMGLFMRSVEQKSIAQLRATMIAYKQLSKGKDISDAVAKTTHNNAYVHALTKFVTCICQPSSVYAEKIHKHLHPEDPVFLDILIYKSQADIAHIKVAYKKRYGEELLDHLKDRGNHATYRVLYDIISKAVDASKAKTAAPAKMQAKKAPGLISAQSKQELSLKKPKSEKQNPISGKTAGNKTSIERNVVASQSRASTSLSKHD